MDKSLFKNPNKKYKRGKYEKENRKNKRIGT